MFSALNSSKARMLRPLMFVGIYAALSRPPLDL